MSDSAQSLSGMELLFVDDSADERDLFECRLKQFGVGVTTAATANEAIAVLSRGTTDVVLTDICLGECSGIDLVEVIRGLEPAYGAAVPAIAVTGLSDGAERQRVAAAGFDAVLVKPYDTASLVEAVAGVANRVASLRALRARYAAQRQEQIDLRERLVRQRQALSFDRLRHRAKYGVGQEREDARLTLAFLAARDYAQRVAGRSVDDIDVVGPMQVRGEESACVLVVRCGPCALTIEATVDRKGTATARALRAS